jgi:hypothetical protein
VFTVLPVLLLINSHCGLHFYRLFYDCYGLKTPIIVAPIDFFGNWAFNVSVVQGLAQASSTEMDAPTISRTQF